MLQQEKIKSLESQVENLLEKEKQLLEELQQDQLNHKVSVSQFELKLEDNDSLLAQSKNQLVISHDTLLLENFMILSMQGSSF